jgi:two-component system cell cycle response regulator
MTDEPVVRQWLSVCGWPPGAVDYVVCPVNAASLIPEQQQMLQNLSEVTELLHQKEQRIRELETLVMQDDLTGLKNRRYLKHFLPMILKTAQANQCQVTLLLFDIDDFKHYNDSYGHSVGDDVLRQTAKLIRRCCRNQDVVVRLGGDEFAVVFWDVPGMTEKPDRVVTDRRKSSQEHPREAVFMAERFRNEMHQTAFDLLGPKGRGSLTISGGLSTFPTDAKTAQELFEKADRAMLEAKRSGKNRIYLVGRPA